MKRLDSVTLGGMVAAPIATSAAFPPCEQSCRSWSRRRRRRRRFHCAERLREPQRPVRTYLRLDVQFHHQPAATRPCSTRPAPWAPPFRVGPQAKEIATTDLCGHLYEGVGKATAQALDTLHRSA